MSARSQWKACGAVADFLGETVRAKVVGIGRVDEAAEDACGGAEADLAVLGAGDQLWREGHSACAVACCDVSVEVIGLHGKGGAAVLGQGGGVCHGHRGADQAHIADVDLAAQLAGGEAKADQVEAEVDRNACVAAAIARRYARQVQHIGAAAIGVVGMAQATDCALLQGGTGAGAACDSGAGSAAA